MSLNLAVPVKFCIDGRKIHKPLELNKFIMESVPQVLKQVVSLSCYK